MAYGTLYTLDLLINQLGTATVADVGEPTVWQAIEAEVAAHNRLLGGMIDDLAETSTDRIRVYGGRDQMVMEEIDEFGTPDAQKVTAGTNVGFPLRRHAIAVQWTRHFMQRVSVAQLAAQFDAARSADLRAVRTQLARALFGPANFSFLDRLAGRQEERITLNVKRLVNADGAVIPLGPNGESFDGATHTHYLGTASFVAANLTALIETVSEHYATGEMLVYINRAQEAAIRAFTGFTAYVDARIIPASTAEVGRTALNTNALYDRPIGLFAGAEIHVKPWIPANYVLAFLRGQPKPLVMRQPTAGPVGFNVEADDEDHPLRARVLAHEFGFGVWNRTNGAVLQTNSATYSAPVISY